MTQKFYLRDTASNPPPTSGEKSTTEPVGSQTYGLTPTDKDLSFTKGTTATSAATTLPNSTTANNGTLGRWSSGPLAAGTYGSGNWTIAIQTAESNALYNVFWRSASIYFWRPSSNSVVGFVIDSNTQTGVEFGNGVAATRYGQVLTWVGSNVTIVDGDILVFEAWTGGTPTMGTAGNTATIYYDGTTDVTAAYAGTDPASYINAPANIPEKVSLALTPATAVTSAVALTRTGAVSLALGVPTTATSAVALGITNVIPPISLALAPATVYVAVNTNELTVTSGLVARFDSDIPSSIVADSTGAMSQWSDVSGSGFHVVQATTAKKPTSDATQRLGRNVVEFSRAAAQVLAKTGISTTVTSVFVMFRFATLPGTSAPFGTDAAAFCYAAVTNGNIGFYAGTAGMGSSNTHVTGNWYAMAEVINSPNGVIQFDGVTTLPTPGTNPDPGNTVAAAALYVGDDSSTDYLNGSVAEILAYSDVKNAADRAAILAYLDAKWNNVGNSLGITAAVSLALTPAVVASSAVALTSTAAVSLALAPAVVSTALVGAGALALDTTAFGKGSSVGPQINTGVTISHTLGGGTDRLVVVCVEGRNAAGVTAPAFNTVTYNGTAMTLAVAAINTSKRVLASVYYLLDASLPAAGTYNVVLNLTDPGVASTLTCAGEVYAFTGAKQTAQPDATSTYADDATGPTSVSNNITTVAAGAWILDALAVRSPSGTSTENSPQANAIKQPDVGNGCLSNASTLGPVSPAGVTSMGWTWVGAQQGVAYSQASFATAAANLLGITNIAAGSSLPLTPATTPTSAVALGITPGAASIALAPAVVSTSAVALVGTGAVSLALAPAVVSTAIGVASAIAHDASTSGTWATGNTTTSFSHTIGGGTNRLLVVLASAEQTGAPSTAVTGITYNGVPLSLVTVRSTGQSVAELWYLLDASLPAAGTYTVAVSWSGTATVRNTGSAVSVSGAAQTAPEVSATGIGSGTSLSNNITTLTNNAWVFDVVTSETGTTLTAAAGQDQRAANNQGSTAMAASTKLVASAGSTAMAWTNTPTSASFAQVMAAWPPGVGANLLGITVGNPQPALTPVTVATSAVGLGIAGTGATSIPATPATVTTSAVALGITAGAVSIALAPATVTTAAVSLTASAAVSLALAPAVVSTAIGVPSTIAHDATTQGGDGSLLGATMTFAHVVGAGSDRLLLVSVGVEDVPANNFVVSVTYNGVSLTQLATLRVAEPTSQFADVWYLVAPAVGTFNVVVTLNAGTGGNGWTAQATSLFGATQGAPEVFITSSTAVDSTTYSTAITTLTANAWAYDVVVGNAGVGNLTADAGQVRRSYLQTGGAINDVATSTKVVASPGSTTLGWSTPGTNEGRWVQIVAAWAPAVGANLLGITSAVSLALTPATVGTSAVGLGIAGTGPISIALAPATVATAAVALTTSAAVSLALAPAVVSTAIGAPSTVTHDASTALGNAVGASQVITTAHTIGSGANRILLVQIGTEVAAGAQSTAASVTYNGVALTKLTSEEVSEGAGARAELWYLLEASLPAAGTYNVVVTFDATVASNAKAAATSLINVAQGAPEASTTSFDTTDNTTYSKSITTLTANAWVVDSAAVNNTATVTATGTGQVLRTDLHTGGSTLAASTTPVPVAGSATISYAYSAAQGRIAWVLAAWAPALTANVLGITPGGVSLALTPATVATSAVGLGIAGTGTTSIPANPATVTVSAVALGVTVGAVSVALAPATVATSAVALVRSAGAVSVALTPATTSTSAVALGITAPPPGSATLPLTPATVATAAVALTCTPGATTAPLTAATVVTAAVALTTTVGGVTRALTPSTVATAAVSLGVSSAPPGLTLALTPASAVVSAPALGRTLGLTSVGLVPATVTVSAVALVRTGAVTRALAPAVVVVTAVAVFSGAQPGHADGSITTTDEAGAVLTGAAARAGLGTRGGAGVSTRRGAAGVTLTTVEHVTATLSEG